MPTTQPKVPSILLAQTWDGEQDVTGWFLSEKLDGVRAYWDGRQFLSRQGNVYHAPAWFRAELPLEPFDGELWMAHKSFQRTVNMVCCDVSVRFDRIGTGGQCQTKTFPDPAGARKYVETQNAAKVAKGYCETTVA